MSRSLSFHSGDELPKKYYIRARRIILVRHGESEGNKDERAYVHTPDWRIALTDEVCDQFSCGLNYLCIIPVVHECVCVCKKLDL